MTLKRIDKEFLDMSTINPVPNFSVCKTEDPFHWQAVMSELDGSVYGGGIFWLNIRFPNDYPFKPPKINFITKIFHTNINGNGSLCPYHMCDGVLQQKWSAALTISIVLKMLKQSVLNPVCCDFVDFDQLFLVNRAKWDAKAREWTKKYAQ